MDRLEHLIVELEAAERSRPLCFFRQNAEELKARVKFLSREIKREEMRALRPS